LYIFRFQDQYEDAETGLYYNRFRYYDPLTGQYLSPDPIGLGGGLRPNAYVHNPNTHIDPLGLSTKDVPSLTYNPRPRNFRGDEAIRHFDKHGGEIMGILGRNNYNLKDYISDANHVIARGQFTPELNGFVKLIGGQGSAKYAFVGLDRTGRNITTFHIKTASELSRKAPSLGIVK